jgi:hypothetical protein
MPTSEKPAITEMNPSSRRAPQVAEGDQAFDGAEGHLTPPPSSESAFPDRNGDPVLRMGRSMRARDLLGRNFLAAPVFGS